MARLLTLLIGLAWLAKAAGHPVDVVTAGFSPRGYLTVMDTLPARDSATGKLQAAKPQEIAFLLDVSNSMGQGRKMELLKKSMTALLDKLRPVDHVSLITFGNDVLALYRTTSFSKPDSLLRIIEHVRSTATATNVNGAIDMAYEQAMATPAGTTRQELFLITDGEFKLNKRVITLVKDHPAIRLTAVIVGEGESAEKAGAYVRERSDWTW